MAEKQKKNQSNQSKDKKTTSAHSDREPLLGNFGHNLQKAGRNFGNGIRALFGVKEKPPLPDPTQSSKISTRSNKDSTALTPEQIRADGNHTLDQMEEDWDAVYEDLLEKYRNKFQKENENVRLRHKVRLRRMKRRNRAMHDFFEDQRHEWNKKLLENKEQRVENRAQRKEEFHEKLDVAQSRWARIADRNQKRVENLFKGISRVGWRLQFRIILILLPLILLIILLYILFEPILSKLP